MAESWQVNADEQKRSRASALILCGLCRGDSGPRALVDLVAGADRLGSQILSADDIEDGVNLLVAKGLLRVTADSAFEPTAAGASIVKSVFSASERGFAVLQATRQIAPIAAHPGTAERWALDTSSYETAVADYLVRVSENIRLAGWTHSRALETLNAAGGGVLVRRIGDGVYAARACSNEAVIYETAEPTARAPIEDALAALAWHPKDIAQAFYDADPAVRWHYTSRERRPLRGRDEEQAQG